METLGRIGVASLALVMALACNAINGVGDLSVDEEGEPPPLPERTMPDPANDAGGADGPSVVTATCACAPAAPVGWQGPVTLAESAPGAPAAPCDGPLVTAFHGGVVPAAPGGCEPCTCGAASGGARCDVSIGLYGTGSCTLASKCAQIALSGTSCAQATYCNTTGSLSNGMKTSLTPVGTCGAPSGGALLPAPFEREATACAVANAPAGACESGMVCAPPAGTGTKTCVSASGDVACPAGPYTVKTTYFAGVDDTRACSACTCQAQCSGGSTRIHDDGVCGGSLDATGPNVCDSFTASALTGSVHVVTPPTFSCAPSGGALSGTLTGKDLTTFCCLP